MDCDRLTAVRLRAHMLPGMAVSGDRGVRPVIDFGEGGDDSDEDVEGEVGLRAMDIHIEPNCKSWNGWRTSYRAEDPTEPKVQKIRKILRRKREWLQPIRDRLKAEAPRHTPHTVRWQRAQPSLVKKANRRKRIRAKMAAKRKP